MVKGELKSVRITLESTDTGVLGYVYLRDIAPGEAARTEKIMPGVNADLDATDKVVGVEFLNAERFGLSLMQSLAEKLKAPELAAINLSELCKTAA